MISPTVPLSKSLSMPGLASNPCPLEFDAIASTEAFRSVLASTEKCLLGNRGVPTLFAFRSPAMTFTGLVAEEVLDRQIPSELEPACKRLRLSVSHTDLLGALRFLHSSLAAEFLRMLQYIRFSALLLLKKNCIHFWMALKPQHPSCFALSDKNTKNKRA